MFGTQLMDLVNQVKTAIATLPANIGTIRHECLDQFLFWTAANIGFTRR